MSKINAENIDELIFDYFEGNLNSSQMAEIDAFIEANPDYQIDFNAWKDSFLSKPKDKYLFADQLIAGTGAAWLKWSMLGFFLAALSATALYYSGSLGSPLTNEKQYESESTVVLNNTELMVAENSNTSMTQESVELESNEMVDYSSDQSNNENTYDSEGTAPLSESVTSRTSSVQHEDHSADNTAINNNAVVKNNNSANSNQAQKRGNIAQETMGTTQTEVGIQSNSGSNSTFEQSLYSQTRDSKLFGTGIDSVNDNLALAQAMNFFNTSGGGTANDFSRHHRVDQILDDKNSARKRQYKPLLVRLIDKITNPFNQTIGLRNFRDPYFVIPEYYNPLMHNSSFVGSFNALNASLSARSGWSSSENSVLSSVFSVDGKVHIGKKKANSRHRGLKMGLGLTGNLSTAKTDEFSYLSQEYNVIASPKFNLGQNTTLEPAVNLAVGNILADYGANEVRTSFETSEGMIRNFNSIIEGENEHKSRRSLTYVDAGASVLLHTAYFYTGIDVRNILGSANSDYFAFAQGELPMTTTGIIGTDYKYSQRSNTCLSPYAMVINRGSMTDLWGGLNLSYGKQNKFMMGAGYGSGGEFAAMLGFHSRSVKLSLKTDYTRSRILNQKYLSHEVSMRFFVGNKTQTLDLPLTEGH